VMELLKIYGAKFFTSVRGDTKIKDRHHIVERMKNGTLDIVVSSSVFNEGMDAPNLRTVIDATGQSSWIASIQEPGRGTRPFEGKDTFKMYDFNDVGNKWFEAHTAQRFAAYAAAGFTVPSPNKHATKVLDTVRERSNMFEPTLYAAPKGFDWKALIGFGIIIAGLAAVQMWLR
jgi:superfamily II DNA or RNA helicase